MASVPPAPTGMPQQQPMPQQQAMPTQMFASGGSVKDILSPDFSSIERLMQGLGGGVGVSDEGTAKWWNPVAGLPHVQYANLVASGEPMLGLPLGNPGNVSTDVSELAGVYEPPAKDYFGWDDDEYNPFRNRKKMSAGGLLNYANGGIVDDPYGLNLQSVQQPPIFAPFPMDTIAPMPQDEFESLYGLETLTDYEPYAGPSAVSGTMGPILPEVGEAAYPYSRQAISPAIEDQLRRLSTDTVSEEYSPLRYGLATAAKGLMGYGTEEETEKEITARKINTELRGALNEIQSQGGVTGIFRGKKGEHDRITGAEDFYEGLMPHGRPTGESVRVAEADTITVSRFFANNPDEYAKLNYLTEKFGPKEGLVKYSETNKGLIDRLNKGVEEVAEVAEVVTPVVQADDGKAGGKTATQLRDKGFQSSTLTGSSTGAEDDMATGLLDTSIENLIKDMTDPKGKMQDKWLAIAAGAFNAAQKGSPTLMQGLADLGGGVVGQLQNLKKEDRLKAQQLFELYKTKSAYASSMATSRSTSALAYSKHMESIRQNLASNVNNYEQRLAKAKELGDESTARLDLAVQYANHGVPSAQLDYRQGVQQIADQEKLIEVEVREDLDLDVGQSLTDEAKEQMTNSMKEFLSNNPSLGRLNQDYWSRAKGLDGEYKLSWQDRILTWSPVTEDWDR
tara:strand:- start:1220 stop:3253 length:2034 start_codon:yes stop_codon:yes gene_type:complete